MHSVLPVGPRFKQTHFGRSLYFSWMDTTRISACHCKTIDFLRLPATVIMFGTRNVCFWMNSLSWHGEPWDSLRLFMFVLLSMACWLQWTPVFRSFLTSKLFGCEMVVMQRWASSVFWRPSVLSPAWSAPRSLLSLTECKVAQDLFESIVLVSEDSDRQSAPV